MSTGVAQHDKTLVFIPVRTYTVSMESRENRPFSVVKVVRGLGDLEDHGAIPKVLLSTQRRSMRVIVDEGPGETSPLWQQFQTWLGERRANIVWLTVLWAIPDVEILDNLLTPQTVLLTQDGVLHNRALRQGTRSLTLNTAGQLTRKPLPLDARRLREQAPSVVKTLKSSYQHEPHPIALQLSADRSLKVLKAQRTRRRRMQGLFWRRGPYRQGLLDHRLAVNWLRVLGTAEMPDIDHRVGHQFHRIVPTLDALKPHQEPLEFVLPGKGPLHSIS